MLMADKVDKVNDDLFLKDVKLKFAGQHLNRIIIIIIINLLPRNTNMENYNYRYKVFSARAQMLSSHS